MKVACVGNRSEDRNRHEALEEVSEQVEVLVLVNILRLMMFKKF